MLLDCGLFNLATVMPRSNNGLAYRAGSCAMQPPAAMYAALV
jgi:hypothetical protein